MCQVYQTSQYNCGGHVTMEKKWISWKFLAYYQACVYFYIELIVTSLQLNLQPFWNTFFWWEELLRPWLPLFLVLVDDVGAVAPLGWRLYFSPPWWFLYSCVTWTTHNHDHSRASCLHWLMHAQCTGVVTWHAFPVCMRSSGATGVKYHYGESFLL